MDIVEIEGPLDGLWSDEVFDLIDETLDKTHRESLLAEMRQKFDLVTHVAVEDGAAVGYKIGCQRRPRGDFYSWLGGVAASHRRRGVGSALMLAQHDWARARGYHTIRTISMNRWRGMLLLNIKHGFDIIGTLTDERGVKIVLSKSLKTEPETP